MNLRAKIVVNRVVGLPLARALNLLARILGRLLRRDHGSSPEKVKTIVVSKYVGMGSILQATPLIRALRATYPEATIIFVTGVTCRRLVERLEHIDRIITVDDRGLFRLGRTTLRTIAQLIRAQGQSLFRPGGLLGLCEHHRPGQPVPQPAGFLSRVGPAQAGQLHAPHVLQHEEPDPVHLHPARRG